MVKLGNYVIINTTGEIGKVIEKTRDPGEFHWIVQKEGSVVCRMCWSSQLTVISKEQYIAEIL